MIKSPEPLKGSGRPVPFSGIGF